MRAQKGQICPLKKKTHSYIIITHLYENYWRKIWELFLLIEV